MLLKDTRVRRNTAIFLVASSVYFYPVIGDFYYQLFSGQDSKLGDFLFADSGDAMEELIEETNMLRILRRIKETHHFSNTHSDNYWRNL